MDFSSKSLDLSTKPEVTTEDRKEERIYGGGVREKGALERNIVEHSFYEGVKGKNSWGLAGEGG